MATTTRTKTRNGGPRYFIGLGVGTGFGYAKGNGDNDAGTPYSVGRPRDPRRPWQFTPEVGYWLRPDLMLSVQIRYQMVTGTTEWVDPSPMGHSAQGDQLRAGGVRQGD